MHGFPVQTSGQTVIRVNSMRSKYKPRDEGFTHTLSTCGTCGTASARVEQRERAGRVKAKGAGLGSEGLDATEHSRRFGFPMPWRLRLIIGASRRSGPCLATVMPWVIGHGPARRAAARTESPSRWAGRVQAPSAWVSGTGPSPSAKSGRRPAAPRSARFRALPCGGRRPPGHGRFSTGPASPRQDAVACVIPRPDSLEPHRPRSRRQSRIEPLRRSSIAVKQRRRSIPSQGQTRSISASWLASRPSHSPGVSRRPLPGEKSISRRPPEPLMNSPG